MEFFRRRKRLVLGLAAGAAGAAATYYWWASYTSSKLHQQRSVEMELSAILRGSGLEEGAADRDADADGDDCGSPDLDESLDCHFNYIQKVSAPQELSDLLPRIKENLFRLTDVSIIKQRQAAQQQQVVASGSGGVQGQLQLLACLCFGRTVAAAYLLPLMDLCVRTKLNIIGRHLFLQEKFSKLRQPAAPAARMQLPPRLTAAAAEAFLACEQLAERGCAWLVEQAMSAAELMLQRVPVDTNVTPEELAELVQAVASALEQAVTAAGAASATGNAWVDAVVGPSASPAFGMDAAAAAGSGDAYKRARASAAMVEELEAELRRVLCNYRFSDAMHAAVSQCLSTCAAHIHATFISQAAAAQAPPAPPGPAPQPPQAPPSSDGGAKAPGPANETQAGDRSPVMPARVVSPFSTSASGFQSCATSSGCAASASTGDSLATATSQEVTAAAGAPTLAARRASLAAAAVAAMQPRPLARCLKAVQGACDPLFMDAKEVSARIAGLPPVMSLCAVAFAAPLEY